MNKTVNRVPQCGWLETALVAFALGVMAVLTAYSAFRSSPLFDEPAHFASGVVLGRTGDPGYFKVNPPVNKWITAIFVDAMDIELPMVVSSASFSNFARPEFEFGDRVLEDNHESYLGALRIARYARIPFLLLGGWLLWKALQWQVPWRRVLVVWLWAFSPLVLAHGWVVSADALAGVAMCCILITAPLLWQTPNRWSYACSGVAWGLAIGTKFTFAPMYIGFLISMEGTKILAKRSTAGNWWQWLGRWLVHASVACLVVNVLYFFEGTGKRLGEHDFISHLLGPYGFHSERIAATPSEVAKFVSMLPSPFPESFLEGIDQQLADMDRPRGAYLFGQRLEGKLPWFFLVGYWLKEQLAVLIAGALVVMGSIGHLFRRGVAQSDVMISSDAKISSFSEGGSQSEGDARDNGLAVFVSLQLLAFCALMATQSNLVWNMRYLIPALPMIYVLLALGLPAWGSWQGKLRVMPLTCVGLLAVMLLECAWIAPFHFSYINPMFGGSRRIPLALNDSNFDYGQDVLWVRHWYERESLNLRDGDQPILMGVLSGHGREWLGDICPIATNEWLQQALEYRKADGDPKGDVSLAGTGSQQWLVVSRGLEHPEPWALRYSSFANSSLSVQSHENVQELLSFEPDVWVTPVIVAYRVPVQRQAE